MCKRKGHERSLRIFKSKQVVKNSTEPEVEEIKGIHEQQYLSDREVGHRLKAVPDVQGVTEDTRFKATTELYRRLCCTLQRMQLVVMAAVLALAGAGQGCSFGCHPTNISILVESCGRTELVYTTICEGQCYHKVPVYISNDDDDEQKVCNGDWSYEVKHIKGCPVGVSYPVARNCECTKCNPGDTHCGRFPGDIPSCLPF